MGVILLDTTIASLLHPKKERSTILPLYKPYMTGNVLAVSFQTIGELWEWPLQNNWGTKKTEEFEDYLQSFLVIPYDDELAKDFATVRTFAKRQGRRLEAGDAWIIATAISRNLTLLTHDRDLTKFAFSGVKIVSFVDTKKE